MLQFSIYNEYRIIQYDKLKHENTIKKERAILKQLQMKLRIVVRDSLSRAIPRKQNNYD